MISPTVRFCQEAACHNFGSEERAFKISSYIAFGSVSQATTTALMAFSSTVWTERCIFFITRTQADDEVDFNPAIRLARAAALAYSGATTSIPKGFGKAGTRTAKQTALAKAYAEGRVAAIPVGDAMAYTDGASRGNPGDAGSGTSLSIKGETSHRLDYFEPLGKATNNCAELWAIGVALSLLPRLPREGRPYNLHILTDSEYSIGCIEGGFSTKVNKLLVRSIRKLMKKLVVDEILGTLSFVWVPGHADLEGNERADLLANFGADGSAAGRVCDMVLAMDQAFFIPD